MLLRRDAGAVHDLIPNSAPPGAGVSGLHRGSGLVRLPGFASAIGALSPVARGAILVVVPEPSLHLFADIGEGWEPGPVQSFRSEPSVEGDEGQGADPAGRFPRHKVKAGSAGWRDRERSGVTAMAQARRSGSRETKPEPCSTRIVCGQPTRAQAASRVQAAFPTRWPSGGPITGERREKASTTVRTRIFRPVARWSCAKSVALVPFVRTVCRRSSRRFASILRLASCSRAACPTRCKFGGSSSDGSSGPPAEAARERGGTRNARGCHGSPRSSVRGRPARGGASCRGRSTDRRGAPRRPSGSTRASPHGSGRRACAGGQASALPADDVLQHLLGERLVRHRLPEPAVFVPGLLQPPHPGRQQPILPLRPVGGRRLADRCLAADLRHGHPAGALVPDERLRGVRGRLRRHRRPLLPAEGRTNGRLQPHTIRSAGFTSVRSPAAPGPTGPG